MFYTKGIDITNDKQMFNFLKNHFTYWTLNSRNRGNSIANNVKLYNLNLSGDWSVALAILENNGYEDINVMIHDWEREHRGYHVFFNGRNGGYLVLTEGYGFSVLPQAINECEDYEEYKRYCKEFYGAVKANRFELVEYTKLVQSFDRLCDELRDYCDMLSKQAYEVIEMQTAVGIFNEEYQNDLELLGFSDLECDAQGIVNISEISVLACLRQAFCRLARRDHYELEYLPEGRIHLKKKF